jgi:integrase
MSVKKVGPPVDTSPRGKSNRRPAKKWRVRYREADGRERSRWFQTRQEADDFEGLVRVQIRSGTYIDPDAGRETIAAYARQWAEGQPWRPSTRDRQTYVIEKQIVPTFGTRELRKLRHHDVQQWVGRMSAEGLAPSTVASYFRTLASIMKSARDDRLIHESPCGRVKLPRPDRARSALVPLTTEQVCSIAETVAPRYRALVIVSAGLGLRQGEACGLTVDRVNFLRRAVRIDRQLVSPQKGQTHLAPVKTPSSNRVLALPSVVGDELAAHIAQYPPSDDGLVFTSSSGAPLRRSTWGDAFSSAAKRAGLDASTHDLRHHCASLLISAGCSVTSVQHFLGHKNASETLDTYSHLWPDDDDRIRAAIDAGFSPVAEFSRSTAATDL